MEVKKVLDCKGLCCPEPILEIKMAIGELEMGDVIEMHTTDPGSVNDMASWAKRTGHEIVEEDKEGDVFIFRVKKCK